LVYLYSTTINMFILRQQMEGDTKFQTESQQTFPISILLLSSSWVQCWFVTCRSSWVQCWFVTCRSEILELGNSLKKELAVVVVILSCNL